MKLAQRPRNSESWSQTRKYTVWVHLNRHRHGSSSLNRKCPLPSLRSPCLSCNRCLHPIAQKRRMGPETVEEWRRCLRLGGLSVPQPRPGYFPGRNCVEKGRCVCCRQSWGSTRTHSRKQHLHQPVFPYSRGVKEAVEDISKTHVSRSKRN